MAIATVGLNPPLASEAQCLNDVGISEDMASFFAECCLKNAAVLSCYTSGGSINQVNSPHHQK